MTDKNFFLEEAARVADKCAEQNRESLKRARKKAAVFRESPFPDQAETWEIFEIELEAAATEADSIAALIRQMKD